MNFFRRIEKKYILTREQYLFLKEIIKDYLVEDEHGKSTICNIYFDTENYDLIMHSITKPTFKDKVRLRSYNIPSLDDKVFLEIKRKSEGVVSKRRIQLELNKYYEYLNGNNQIIEDTQIRRELDYYFNFYNLKPTMFISYYRRAYYEKNNRDFRITFDSHILARKDDLELEKGNYGEHILEKNKYIMEIKTLGSIPMWLVKLLNDNKIYPCSFSKYGEAYSQLILHEKEKIII